MSLSPCSEVACSALPDLEGELERNRDSFDGGESGSASPWRATSLTADDAPEQEAFPKPLLPLRCDWGLPVEYLAMERFRRRRGQADALTS